MRAATRNRERGSTLLETALVLLTFLCLIIGTVDFAQVLYFHQALVERARAAARYASVNPTDTTGIKNVAVYNTTDGSGTALISSFTTSMVSVANSGNNTTGAVVSVTISGLPIHFLSPYIAQSFNAQSVTVAMVAESQVP